MLYLTDSVKRSIIGHCVEEIPQQACGLVVFNKDGESVESIQTTNFGAWPYGFQISSETMLVETLKAKKMENYIKGVYHSHLASTAKITDRDIYRSVPNGMLYIIVSVLNIDSPEICCYEKKENKFIEIPSLGITV